MNRPAVAIGNIVTATLQPVHDVDALEHSWRELEERADCSFFLSWNWIGPWAQLTHQRTRLFLYACRANDSVVGLAFFSLRNLSRRKGLVRSRQLQLNEYNASGCDMIIEYNGILCANGYEQSCWNALAPAIAQAGVRWDELACRSLTPTQLACAKSALPQFREESDRAFHSWVVALSAGMESEEKLLTLFKRKTRQQMRQSLREYEKLGDIVLDSAATTEQALALFDEMETFHAARWQKVGKAGSFANELWSRFHQKVIQTGFDRGCVQLVRVSCGGSPIGYIYGYPWRGRLYALQTGFKTEQSTALRSGYVAHFKTMQHNAALGVACYDFLPDEASSYKRLLADPAELLTTTCFQRDRLKFSLERLAARGYRTFKNLRSKRISQQKSEDASGDSATTAQS